MLKQQKLIKHNLCEKGFTLMELILVLTVIGILAAVLIGVINPNRQRDRARDGNTIAIMNKAVLSAQVFVNGYVRAPTGQEFLSGLQNACAATFMNADGTCSTPSGSAIIGCWTSGGVPHEHCLFEVENSPLPGGPGTTGCCTVNLWSGSGLGNCYFRYERVGGANSTRFRIYAKSYGLSNRVFQYDSDNSGEITDCDASGSLPC